LLLDPDEKTPELQEPGGFGMERPVTCPCRCVLYLGSPFEDPEALFVHRESIDQRSRSYEPRQEVWHVGEAGWPGLRGLGFEISQPVLVGELPNGLELLLDQHELFCRWFLLEGRGNAELVRLRHAH
jgi:hypothetical protein